ncbi:muts domain V-domain-containing protein [Irpex rosettiformis]|uniref:Muts domain V-domain-containing protein n=1 Tax=Irpex rosettiformis TaxID=378272 RepID=A0ACB8U0N5_9APHY|nr:muts domain V-domain-containing protein [Irpex rosettiformis]
MSTKSKPLKRRHANTRSSEEDVESSRAGTNTKRVRWDADVEDSEPVEEMTESEGEGESEKVCLAVTCQFGRTGGAYYDPVTSKIFVLEDSHESPQFDITRMLVEQADPDVLLVSSKAEDGCIDALREYMTTTSGVFQVRPYKDFLPAKGRDRVLSLRLLTILTSGSAEDTGSSEASSESEPRNAYEFMRKKKQITGDPTIQRWNASIRLANHASIDHSPLCLGSLGALLDHLVRVRAVGELDDEGIGGLDIRDIESLALKEVMQINADALCSLQIFDNENHASIHSDKTKEGLSLFGILNNTRTSLGRNLMRQWLLRPSMSISVIAARHDAVACFMRPENINTANRMHTHLKGIKNVPKMLSALGSGKAKISDWLGLVKFAFHSVMLRDTLSELGNAGHVEVVKKLSDTLDVVSFKEVGNKVNRVIDWEESSTADRVCVRPHIDEDLDQWKHIYHGIDTVLSNVAEHISNNVPRDYAATLNVVYFPQLGFLISIPMLEDWKDGNITELEGWSFQFSSESQVYFKSEHMHDLDKHIGDVHSFIVDKEIEIIQKLLEEVMVYGSAMMKACDICAELDCLLSFAEASRSYNYLRPVVIEDNVLIIKDGRHPLQELVTDTFVPNDTFLIGADFSGDIHNLDGAESIPLSQEDHDNSILVCTGANACGKSVYLKQVAMIQYMAQIGCFVPATSATLGIVDKIFTRIQTRESVSKVQSAFMIDLNQVSLALRNCTSRSLVLLDEFGKGTISADGAGLFHGVLKHFIGRGPSCAKVLAATHFHEIFGDDMLTPEEMPITFVHMQIMLIREKGDPLKSDDLVDNDEADGIEEEGGMVRADQITYLYRVAKGLSLNSFAATCAQLFGLPRQVVQRARHVSRLLSTHELGLLLDEDMTDKERVEFEEAEEVCRKFLAWDLNTAKETNCGSIKQMLRQVLCKVVEE